jgi:hypothetical protein
MYKNAIFNNLYVFTTIMSQLYALFFSEVPACFSVLTDVPWHEGLKETCRGSEMTFAPMRYLGFPFVETDEQWTIHVPMKRLQLKIFDFYLPCQSGIFYYHYSDI